MPLLKATEIVAVHQSRGHVLLKALTMYMLRASDLYIYLSYPSIQGLAFHKPSVFDSKCQVFVSHAGVPGPEERLWEEWMQKAPDEAAGVLKRDKQITLAEIEATNRVCEPNPMDFPLVIDFLWSDPKGANGYGPSTRVPMVYTFGPDVAQRFLQANNLKYMLRSHETKSAGYQEPKFNPHPTFDKFGGISI